MTHLIFHGRHIAHTLFQEKYLQSVLEGPIAQLSILGDRDASVLKDEKISHVIFAVTSANQSNSRYNPLPFYLRAISIDRFYKPLRQKFGVPCTIVGIPHFSPTNRYIELLIKEIQESTTFECTPGNTIALASTESIIKLYRDRGFMVLPAEFDPAKGQICAPTPMDVIKKLGTVATSWKEDVEIQNMLAQETSNLWDDYPAIPQAIQEIWREPLLTESGSLTETRNYSTYAFGMAHGALLDLKYNDIKSGILPGRIVDEGCADGALMTKIVCDFPDSDVIGIEITSEFLARCRERQRAGEFGNAFVFFHQRNLMQPIFEDNSIDTTICNSTTHEIWSYGEALQSLQDYCTLKYRQLRKGGRLIIRDVVGPENKEREVYMKLSRSDGINEDIFENFGDPHEYALHVQNLSTEAKFYRFSQDFLADMRTKGKRGDVSRIVFREEHIAGEKYFVLRLKDAVEFMTKKDYADNFKSELNEEFAFFSLSEWKELLREIGFTVNEYEHDPVHASRVYTNSWIVENRFKDKVTLYEKVGSGLLRELPYPPTNMVIIAEK